MRSAFVGPSHPTTESKLVKVCGCCRRAPEREWLSLPNLWNIFLHQKNPQPNNLVGLQFVYSPAISQNLLMCNHWRPSCSRFFCRFSTCLMFTQCVDKRLFLCLWHSPAHPVTSSLWYPAVIFMLLFARHTVEACPCRPWCDCRFCASPWNTCPACRLLSQAHISLLCHDPLHHFLSVVLPTALLPLAVYKTSHLLWPLLVAQQNELLLPLPSLRYLNVTPAVSLGLNCSSQ